VRVKVEFASFLTMAQAAMAGAALSSTISGKPSLFSRICSAGPIVVAVLSEFGQILAIVGGAFNPVVIIASVFNMLVTAPIIIYFSWMKRKYSTFRDLLNNLGDELKKLEGENELFTERVDNLGEAVTGLKEFEGALSAIADRNGRDVNQMVKLVKESQRVTNLQRACIKKQVEVDMTRVVLDAFDSSISNVFLDDKALGIFMLGLGNVESIIITDEKEVKRAIKATDRSLLAILKLVNTMVEEDGDGTSRHTGNFGVQVVLESKLTDEEKEEENERASRPGADSVNISTLFDGYAVDDFDF